MVLDSYMNTDVKTSSAISISDVHVADTCNTYNLRSDVMQINYFQAVVLYHPLTYPTSHSS